METPTQPEKLETETGVAKIESKELNVEFQKHILDPNPLQIAFYCKFAGWELTSRTDIKNVIGVQFKEITQYYKMNENTRMMNDAGANFLFHTVVPLISPITTTSNLTDLEIYNTWAGMIQGLIFDLLDSYFVGMKIKTIIQISPLIETEKIILNPFDMQINLMPDIIGYLCQLHLITRKAKGGYSLDAIAKTWITSNIIRSGLQIEQKQGILERFSPFKK